MLATVSFGLCFVAWGLTGGLAPLLADGYHLSASQTALLAVAPVLLGSVARLPMGLLTDHVGGRAMFGGLLSVAALAAWCLPVAGSYPALLATAFVLGLAGASFTIGAVVVSRRTPPARQGTALGLYSLGALGQSVAVFGAPVLAGVVGWPGVCRGLAVLLVAWACVYALLARDASAPVASTGVAHALRELRGAPVAWVLGACYMLTFGGVVAFSLYLPTLLRNEFQLTPTEAGLRAGLFVVLATLVRPLGGWLSDRFGGVRVLRVTCAGVAVAAWVLIWPTLAMFTAGACACAVLLGLGNGAVFGLVPEHFPSRTGIVTGLVATLGGLGGFFPPLLLGVLRDTVGVIWPGFVLLSLSALALRVLVGRTFAS